MKSVIFCWGLWVLLMTGGLVWAQMLVPESPIEQNRCLVLNPPAITERTPLVLILHGYGANAADLVPVWQKLGFSNCQVVFAEGIFPLSTGGFAWYHPPFEQHYEDVLTSRDYLNRLIAHYLGENKGRPVLFMGFSQGAVMSLETGMNYSGKTAAIVAMSGYLDPMKTLANAQAPRKVPILLVHGTQDPIVPYERALQTQAVLQKAGYHPILKNFPIEHQITPDSLKVVQGFLKKILKRIQK